MPRLKKGKITPKSSLDNVEPKNVVCLSFGQQDYLKNPRRAHLRR